jgi:gas vesicle protein
MKNTTQEYEEHKTNTAAPVVAGLVIGGLAGAGVALLLAPQSGKETRTQIQQKTMELRDRTAVTVDEAISQVKSKTQQLTEDVREKAGEMQHRGQDILVKQLDNVSAAAEAGKAAVKASESKN